MTINKYALAVQLRNKGLSYEQIGKELGGYTRQYVFQILNPERTRTNKDGENYILLSSLKIDHPVFIQKKKKTPDLYKITATLNIRVVIKEIMRNEILGLWLCRIQ